MEQVVSYIEELEAELIELRREFHRYPELGFEEKRTAGRIEETLLALGLDEVERLAGTGVVGTLDAGVGPTIGLRADIDALPIPERTNLSYKSRRESVMHACGHDGHTAILVTAAKVLAEFKDRLSGKIKFIFQPAEEGPGGAQPLIEAGVLSTPEVDRIYALHINNQLPTGAIGIHSGVASAAADELDILIKGEGGHASTPQQGTDAIVVSSQIVTGLQTIISRQISPLQQVVVNIGKISGGYRRNVIADRVKMSGTIRTTDSKLRQRLPAKVEEIIAGITSAYGADYELDYSFGYPVLVNSSALVEELEPVIKKMPYLEELRRLTEPSLGSEDFAYYLEELPGVFFRLGAAELNRTYHSAHHPQFDFDERALKIGVALFVYLCFAELAITN